MCAPRPAAGPTLALLKLLPGTANTAFSGLVLLGVLDPADELVAGQSRDVLPRIECERVGHQRLPQVGGKLVHHPARDPNFAHCGQGSVPGRASFAVRRSQHSRRTSRRKCQPPGPPLFRADDKTRQPVQKALKCAGAQLGDCAGATTCGGCCREA
jgi:hypothetical protein